MRSTAAIARVTSALAATVATATTAMAMAACSFGDNRLREGCEAASCHGSPGTARGIEEAHPKQILLCTDCHGGNPTSTDKAIAHVAPAPEFVAERDGYLKNLSVDELDRVAPEFLRFVNPGDYRVADVGCGVNSPANGGSGCHQEQVYSAARSTMATFTGHFNVPRFQAGMQDRPAVFGSRTLSDTQAPSPQPRGSVPEIVQAVIPPQTAPRDTVETAMDHYLPKNCTHCHQWNFGRNDARGNFRSSGCTACHMLYNNDGITASTDPSAVRERAPHPEKHQLTVEIPENQCEHCHFQGARIGLLYRGVIEWGFTEPAPLPNIGESLHNHPPEFYLDAASDPRTPADVHYTAGMACADCHIGRDVHGDGRIYSTAKFQVSVRCENCHGNIDNAIVEGTTTAGLTRGGVDTDCQVVPNGSPYFLTCNGDPLKRMYRADDGRIYLRPVKGGPDLPVRQVAEMLQNNPSPNMVEGMGRNPVTGYSHTEDIECHGCHTAYRQYCFGCHVTMDYSQSKTDLLTGAMTPGAEVTGRQAYSLDLYFIGENRKGKIASFCPSMQVFMTAVDRDDNGDLVTYYENRVRTAASGKVGFNWGIDMPHVTSSVPQNCTLCHADSANGCDTTNAMAAYGFGTGRFEFTDDSGTTHDLTQLLDAAGNPIVDFSHEGQGPVRRSRRDAALSICVEDHPR